MSYFILHLLLCAIKQGMQRMVLKQIRNAVQRELTYITDQCPLLGLVHRLVLGHLHGNYMGAQWLSGRVLDSRPKGRGFEPHRRHCVVVLEQDTFILA